MRKLHQWILFGWNNVHSMCSSLLILHCTEFLFILCRYSFLGGYNLLALWISLHKMHCCWEYYLYSLHSKLLSWRQHLQALWWEVLGMHRFSKLLRMHGRISFGRIDMYWLSKWMLNLHWWLNMLILQASLLLKRNLCWMRGKLICFGKWLCWLHLSLF